MDKNRCKEGNKRVTKRGFPRVGERGGVHLKEGGLEGAGTAPVRCKILINEIINFLLTMPQGEGEPTSLLVRAWAGNSHGGTETGGSVQISAGGSSDSAHLQGEKPGVGASSPFLASEGGS